MQLSFSFLFSYRVATTVVDH